jgi:gliding motility-associated-like protein
MYNLHILLQITLQYHYLWDFDDNNTSTQQNPLHTFINTNTNSELLNVQLKVQSPYGCIDSSNSFVTVGAYFDARMQVSKVSGCSPFQVQFTDISEGGITGRTWYRNGTSFSNLLNPQIVLTNTSGTVRYDTIMMVARKTGTFTCYDTAKRIIAIYPEVDPSFNHLITEGCSPLTVDFTHAANSYDYFWEFGDNSSANIENPSHTFTNDLEVSKPFEVKLVVESGYGCKDSAYSQVTVASRVDAKFTMPSATGCSPFTTTFTDASNGDIASWQWYIDGNPESSNSSVSSTFTNTTSNDIVHNVKLIVTNSGPGNCKDSITKQITVYPEVFANIGQDVTEGCNELDVQFTHTSPNNPTMTYLWDFGDNSSSTNKNPQHTFINDLEVSENYDIKLVVESDYGCKDSSFTQVTVASRIDAKFTMPSATGCSPFSTNFTDVSNGDIASWQWYIDGNLHSSTNSASRTFTNTTSNNTIHNIKLVVTNAGPGVCKDSVTKQITVYPQVFANIGQDVTEGCNPLDVQFTHTSSNNPIMNYLWDFGDNSGSTDKNPQHTFSNDLEISEDYNIKLIVESDFGCKDSAFSQVTVASRIDAKFTMPSAAGCSPFTTSFTDVSTGDIATWQWYVDDNLQSSTNSANVTLTNITDNNTTHNVKLIVTNSGPGICKDSITKQITTYPQVFANIVQDIDEGCNPLGVQFNNNTPNNPSMTYIWDFGDNSSSNIESPSHTFINELETSRTFDINLAVESEYGCSDSDNSQITVASRLKAEFTLPAAAGCSPFTTTFADASEGDIATRRWYIDEILTSTTSGANTTIVNTTNNNLTQNLKLVVTNTGPGNCADSITKVITAYPEVTADFSMDVNRGCNPLPVNFKYEPAGNTVNVNFDWDFGDNTSSDEQDPLHTFEHYNYNGTTSYEVSLRTTSEYGCTNEFQETVTIEKALKAEFITEESAGCNPFTAQFINASKGADSYQWIYGDGGNYNINLPQTVSHEYTNNSYTNPANYTTKLIVSNTGGTCHDSMQQQIAVYPQINASFTASTLEDCHPVEVSFTNLSQGVSSYFWNFDDETNSSQINPTHIFRNTSNTTDKYFNVNLHATNSYECTNDTTITIRVNHNPRSLFTIDQTASCSPLQILATNASVGYNSFEWRTGDGNTSSNNPLNYTYINTSGSLESYKLELFTTTNRNCSDSTSLTLNAYPLVTADFNIEDPKGCNPLTTAFENTSIGTDSYFWDFGNGSTSNQTNPSKRFAITGYNDQTIEITLTASNSYNCIDSITKSLTVYVQPSAEFEAAPITQQFPSNTVNITDLTNGGPFNYNWSFGDGQTSNINNSTSHTYDTWGEYTITLDVENMSYNCTDQASETIIIDPPIVTSAFEIEDTAGCVPHTTSFTAEASQFEGENYEFYWDFGDGEESNEQNPSHEYDTAGVYIVSLTVQGAASGAVSTTGTVTVYPIPEVDFRMEPRLLMIPGDFAQCYNLTPFPSNHSFLWNFGDGSTSTEKNPTQIYIEQGLYDITLTATSTNGCEASETKENYIEVIGKGDLRFPNAFTPSLEGSSNGIYNPDDTSNDIFFPVGEGVTEYNLYIYNRWGELMFHSEDINIGWDGYYNGKICPQDVYIWKAEGKFKNGNTFEQAGDVTLLR